MDIADIYDVTDHGKRMTPESLLCITLTTELDDDHNIIINVNNEYHSNVRKCLYDDCFCDCDFYYENNNITFFGLFFM